MTLMVRYWSKSHPQVGHVTGMTCHWVISQLGHSTAQGPALTHVPDPGLEIWGCVATCPSVAGLGSWLGACRTLCSACA